MNIIDFEASALKRPSYPIQVAVIKTNGETYDSYIKPTENWLDHYVWDPASEAIHNISLATLMGVGRDIDVVARELNEFIGGEVVVCDGGSYDVNWANELYNASVENRRFNIVDVSFVLPSVNDFFINKRLANEALGLVAHDALNDVKIIQLATKWSLE